MRVLQIINSLGTGGAEKLLLDTIPLYRAQDIEMDVLLLWDNDTMFTCELQKMNCCKIHILKKSNHTRDIYNPFAIFKIAKLLKNYDIAHVHLFPAQYFVIFANLLNGRKTKLLFTEHSTHNKRMATPVFAIFDRFVYHFYHKIVSISKDVSLALEKHIPTQKQKIILIENGVNLEKIENASLISKNEIHPNLSDTDFVLCQVSAFRAGKDQLTLIKSLQYLEEKFKIVLIGDGSESEKEKINECIKHLKLEDRVFLLGIKSNIYSIIKSVDINILSSKFEGLSISSIEGMASGKPFIASNAPGLAEMVKGYGVLFEIGNQKELAQHIVALSIDSSYYQSVVLSCKLRAAEFDSAKMVAQHIQLYKETYGSK